MSNKSSVYLPVFLFTFLAIGVLIGRFMSGEGFTTNETQKEINKYGKIIHLIEDHYVDSANIEELVSTSIEKTFEQLDPHSVYIPAKYSPIEESSLEQNFDGIGIYYQLHNDTVMVEYAIENGPSKKAGIQLGDLIIAVDGEEFIGASQQETFAKLRGERGSKVTLTVKRLNKVFDVEVTRGRIPTPAVDMSYVYGDTLGYIKLLKFGQNTAIEFEDALQKLTNRNIKSLIVDLRSNGGGYLDDAQKIINQFLDKNALIVYTKGKTASSNDQYFSDETGLFKKGNLIILVNQNSASASEIVSGALQDNDRALIVGRRTYGKGLVQRPFKLNDGSSLRLTISRYYTPSGRCIQKPYSKDGKYRDELNNRLINGELYHSDSIKVNDSLVYETKNGRIVYGGGGIIPDAFIPEDSLRFTPDYQKIYKARIAEKYAVQILEDFDKEIPQINFSEKFVLNKRDTESIKSEIAALGIEPNDYFDILYNDMKLLVARELYGMEGYYLTKNETDRDFLGALRELKNNEFFIKE